MSTVFFIAHISVFVKWCNFVPAAAEAHELKNMLMLLLMKTFLVNPNNPTYVYLNTNSLGVDSKLLML